MGDDGGGPRCIVIGAGRAGTSFGAALDQAGWFTQVVERAQFDRWRHTATGRADVVLLAVPDDSIESVAGQLEPGSAVVAHCSGSRTLGVLGPHQLVGSIHPLMSLPDPDVGARRLLDACTFAVDGDPLMGTMVADLGGVAVHVPEEQRVRYHAAASIAANHLAALCHQVEGLAQQVGVPTEAYWRLMQTTLTNIAETSPEAALTGPAARGDWATVTGHLDQLADDDRSLYLELCRRAASMAGHPWPEDLQ